MNSHIPRDSLPLCHSQVISHKPFPSAYPHQLNALSTRLQKRRLDLRLLQREAADKLGVEAKTICNWEISRTSPQVRFIPKISPLGYIPYDTQSGTLGKRIVACRRTMGISQKELACCRGVDPSTLGRWERGERRVNSNRTGSSFGSISRKPLPSPLVQPMHLADPLV